MIRVFLFIFFLSIYQVGWGQSYIEFDQYQKSKKVILYPGQTLRDVLINEGYNLLEKDWENITIKMNNKVPYLLNTSKFRAIYLPPQISFQEFLRRRDGSSQSQTKDICQFYSKSLFEKNNTKLPKNYVEFHNMIFSREITVEKGTYIHQYLSEDKYDYHSLNKTTIYVMRANGLKKNQITKNHQIFLPYCFREKKEESFKVNRELAAVPESSKELKPKPAQSISSHSFSSSFVVGQFSIKDQSANTLESNFLKFSLKHRYKFKENYTFATEVAFAKFLSMKHSKAQNEIKPKNYYPEGSFALSRYFNSFALSLSFDVVNYFVSSTDTTSLKLTPTQVNRIAFRPFVSITDNIGMFAHIGSLNGGNISGIDYSLGLNFKINKQFSTSGVLYQSNIKTDNSKESSNAAVLSLGYNF